MNETKNISSVNGWEDRKVSQRGCSAVSPNCGAFLLSNMIQLRENQVEPIRKAIAFFNEKNPKPSLIVLPTAWGKSILTAFVAKNTTDKLIVLQPSKELLEQNFRKYDSLCNIFDDSLLAFNSSKSEYTEDSVQRAYDANGGTDAIIRVLDGNPDRKHILAFAPSVADAISLSEHYPYSAVIYGDMDKAQREQNIADFRAGRLRVLFNVRVLSTGFDYTGIDCIVLGISTASIALYYQIIGRATRIDPNKQDALIIDLGGNVKRFGRVEDLHFEKGKMWRLFGTAGLLLSGIPIDQIGKYTKEDTVAIDNHQEPPVEIMPFGKYKGERIKDIPTDYKLWMIRAFDWNSRNERLRKSIVASL